MSNHTGQGGTARAGGRPKEYIDAAARAKAWRDRRRADRIEPPTAHGDAALLPEATGVLATAVPALAALAQRIEAAVAALTDPAELDERLETTRAAVARQVADAQAQAAAARAELSRARHDHESANLELGEATVAAAEAWEATQAAVEELVQARADHSIEAAQLHEARDEARRDLQSERTARHAAEVSLAAAREAQAVRLEAAAAVAAGLREQLVDVRSDRDAIRARLDARPEPSLIGR
ncbi:hypothetical protein [Pengzhenrongella sp.]|uniref:hypothetical protein n=1 Tax=Pengzhenrongella sp. TaxID=2888820 RepID=UPI002F936594